VSCLRTHFSFPLKNELCSWKKLKTWTLYIIYYVTICFVLFSWFDSFILKLVVCLITDLILCLISLICLFVLFVSFVICFIYFFFVSFLFFQWHYYIRLFLFLFCHHLYLYHDYPVCSSIIKGGWSRCGLTSILDYSLV